jgi:hypothetical protein
LGLRKENKNLPSFYFRIVWWECQRIKIDKGFYDENSRFLLKITLRVAKYMAFGSPKTIVKPIICLLVMVFYLNTKALEEEKLCNA